MNKIDKYIGEEKNDVRRMLWNVWTAISEIVPSARAMGLKVKTTDLVPLRKELDKLQKRLTKQLENEKSM